MEERKLFGTDGIRGPANQPPLTADFVARLGYGAARVIANQSTGNRSRILVGRDTRASGPMLESALAAGLASAGADVFLLGVIPTPAVSLLTRTTGASAGAVISASHNPFQDNGIKFFRADGTKLDDAIELEIERAATGPTAPNGVAPGRINPYPEALDEYVRFAAKTFPADLSLRNMRIAVDTANGASYLSTPRTLETLGAACVVFHSNPDGENINAGCGSNHAKEIARLVTETGADVGISHDGDADRIVLCDEKGQPLDGDELLAIAAVEMLRTDTLAHRTLAATVMSNFGLDACLAKAGGKVARSKVGDRYVWELMVQQGLNLGGEQSGHIIFRDHAPTGDGLVAALQILAVMARTGKPLSELRTCLEKFPQAQRNIRVREKLPVEKLPSVRKLVSQAEKDLEGKGRVLLRYSGTEPLIRLLVEGSDAAQIGEWADRIASEIQSQIGA